MKKVFYAIPLLVIFCLVGLCAVYAATLGPTNCGTGADNAGIGTSVWATPTNACAADSAFAVFTAGVGATFTDSTVKLVKGGTVSGNNNSTGAAIPASPSGTRTFGSGADLWGLTLTPADINASNFGVVYSSTSNTGVVSHYLQATNFGFAVPSTATVNGVSVNMTYGYDGTRRNEVDLISITVTYTPAANAGPSIFTVKSHLIVRSSTLIK